MSSEHTPDPSPLAPIVLELDGEQWCQNCYAFGCMANWRSCECHLHPENSDAEDT